MLKLIKVAIIFLIFSICRAAILHDSSLNAFQNYLTSIPKPYLQYEELFDPDSLYDADLILYAFSLANQQESDNNLEYIEEDLPCKWQGNTVCSKSYQPVCVTDFNCIYVVRNKCHLDKLNCGCALFTTLHAKPDRDLRSKLERLLRDYDDINNEISKDHEQQQPEISSTDVRRNHFQMPEEGELDISEIFETTKKAYEALDESDEFTTTQTTPERAPIIKAGIESLGAIIASFIDLWN